MGVKGYMKKDEIIKLIKYVVGSVLAVLIADAIGVKYAYAAGIITLLTIQDTKKETVMIAVKRIVIFVIMTILSSVIFPIAGYHIWAFGIVLVPYLICCMVLDMKEAITPIAVLCTHYIAAKSCSFDMIANEVIVLMIGVGIGIILNLFMPDSRERLIKYQKLVDDKMIHILKRMSLYMTLDDKTDYTGSCFDELNELLSNLKKEALYYMNNHFMGENDYYYGYMQMRGRQCNILKGVYSDIIRLTTTPEQVQGLSDFIREVAEEFEETNDVNDLLNKLEMLRKMYAVQELPKNREEFENRAMLYHIMEDMKCFLMIKRDYIMEHY